MQKTAAILLLIGSVLFLAAAFSPISRVFAELNAAKKLEILRNGRRAWEIAQVLFSLGALVVAAGLVIYFYPWQGVPRAVWALSGVAALVVGACLWSWHCYLRGMAPQGFAEGALPAWHFATYTLLTQLGLAAVGFALLSSGLPQWVGLTLIGGSLFFLLAYLVFKDMPPFVYYLLTLMMGIMVLRG